MGQSPGNPVEKQVVCVVCHGTGIDLRPFQQVDDGLCSMCGGSGYVDVEAWCENCGRPATGLVEEHFVCDRGGCVTEIEREIHSVDTTGVDNFGFHRGMY